MFNIKIYQGSLLLFWRRTKKELNYNSPVSSDSWLTLKKEFNTQNF